MADRVLVTGARSAAALDLARDFRAAGFEVHVADCAPARIARWSSVPCAVHAYASPRLRADGFVRDVADIVAALDPILVVPTCEEVFHLARPSLAPTLDGRLFAPPADVLATLHAKDRFAAFATGLGLDVPETRTLAASGDVKALAADLGRWVLKPVWSRFGTQAMVRPDAARLAALRVSRDVPWVAQARVVGTEVSFYAVAVAGRVVGFAAYGSDWRLPGGAGYSLAALDGPTASRLRETAVAIAAATGMTGQFACDAIVDAVGRPWLIECNPRSTSGLHFLAGAGDLARAMRGGPSVHGGPRAGPRYLLPAMLTYGVAAAVRRRDARGYLAALRRGRDVVGAPGDRWPALGAFVDGLAFAFGGLSTGGDAASATTADIKWDGETLA